MGPETGRDGRVAVVPPRRQPKWTGRRLSKSVLKTVKIKPRCGQGTKVWILPVFCGTFSICSFEGVEGRLWRLVRLILYGYPRVLSDSWCRSDLSLKDNSRRGPRFVLGSHRRETQIVEMTVSTGTTRSRWMFFCEFCSCRTETNDTVEKDIKLMSMA